ncbi:aspartate beta-hydroxylase domain-containing protein 2 [Amia ocellicauda]|uniref:aspartate beta-hydroxylase domain-containing protein 2 n=1 Tax=Amia ocellicauda TaxID=2972642 RepID=UPI0034646CC4
MRTSPALAVAHSESVMMQWDLESLVSVVLSRAPSPGLGGRPLTGLLWALLVLFLWYCYRVGVESAGPARAQCSRHRRRRPPRLQSASGPVSLGDAGLPFIAMETAGEEEEDEEEEEEELGGAGRCRGYLTPVLGHALFPGQAPPPSRRLYGALQEYAKRYSWAGMGRIHKGLREQGRLLSERHSIQRPQVFFLPDVPSIPFFPRDAQRHDIEVLEASYPIILSEFQAVYQRGVDPKLGWTVGGPGQPKGYSVFSLYSKGVCVALNCRSCPRTYRTLSSLRTFMGANAFGHAAFALLRPGTSLPQGYGPTNTRLRCHLGLQTPPNCELVVGGEPQCWSEGHCLLVDDSFLHSVSHNGTVEDGPRVVFTVDLWHPNVAAAERQALDYIFAPEQ